MARVTAVFHDGAQAERAVMELRRMGISDASLSIISRRMSDAEVERDRGDDDSVAGRMVKGTLAGAGVGSLFGLAAALIPGVGPFITAGAFAAALGATGGAAAAGAIVGATSGALAGALSKAGYSKDEAEFYAPAIEAGGVLVAIDSDEVSTERLHAELVRLGGSVYGASGGRRASDLRPDL
jgi:hypothetical protein